MNNKSMNVTTFYKRDKSTCDNRLYFLNVASLKFCNYKDGQSVASARLYLIY